MASKSSPSSNHLAEQVSAEGFKYQVGQPVLVKGTGRWWTGRNFSATVTDIRASDNTVKVRYADGGYKRFPRAEFERLASSADVNRSLEFGSQAFELDPERLTPMRKPPVPGAIETLQTQLEEAVYRHDFRTAAKIRSLVDGMMSYEDQITRLQTELRAAVSKQDFEKAATIQDSINELNTMHATAASAVASANAGLRSFNEAVAAGDKAKVGSTTGSSSSGANSGKPTEDLATALKKAGKRALGGGLAGAGAMALQVCSLMWMRTIMNYQYRYGSTFRESAKKLYAEGGIPRFYRGIIPALVQGPLSRFGDTASNVGMLALLNSYEATATLPVGVKTIAASATAASFRILLMPVDTVKTVLQVDGRQGWPTLMSKFKAHGPSVFFHGALAASAATFAGHYPWFATFNFLDSHLPIPTETLPKLGRNAFIGFTASAVSDTVSNSIRVIKTYRQTHPQKISYKQAISDVVKQDGVLGLMGRGLQTRIVANGMQGLMFSVLWKFFDEKLHPKK